MLLFELAAKIFVLYSDPVNIYKQSEQRKSGRLSVVVKRIFSTVVFEVGKNHKCLGCVDNLQDMRAMQGL